MALGDRQRRMLAVLRDHGPLVVDALLRLACPETSRREGLNSLHRLVDQGWVSLDGKRHLREVAGAMVWLAQPAGAVSRGAIGRKFVADPRSVSH